jgi:hypothetical protein
MRVKERRPLEWSTALLGIGAIVILIFGQLWIGWPAVAAALVAMVVVRYL